MNADNASLLNVRGEADGENTLAVYYAAGGQAFRARLAPVHGSEAVELTTLEQVDLPEVEGGFLYDEAEVVEEFDPTHVPPVVREASIRPVQTPEEVAHA